MNAISSAIHKFFFETSVPKDPKLIIGTEKKHLISNRDLEWHNGYSKVRMKLPAHKGTDGPFVIELENEPNQHVMMVGHTGSGKSTAMQAFLVRAFLNYKIPFLIIDWSGSYKKLKGMVNLWSVPKELRINPFALRGMEAEKRAGVASETLMHALELTPLQAQKIRESLIKLYDNGPMPELNDLYNALKEQSGDKSFMKMQFTHIANKLKQAGAVFGYEPDEFWNEYSSTCNVVELEGLTDAEKKLVTYALLQRITEEFTSEKRTKLFIALDDAYQALKSTYNNESPISKIVREGRKYGFGLVIATQLLSDLPQAVIANTSLKMVFSYQENLGSRDITNLMNLKYEEQELMRRLPPGWCLLFDQYKANMQEHMPAYVNITGLSEKEITQLSTTGKKADIKPILEAHGMTTNNAVKAELLKKLEIPSVSVYRFVIALRNTGSPKGAYKYLRKKGWLTSLTTIYGTKSKPSILARAKASGYVDNEGELTEKAINIIDPKLMIEKQGIRAGSEEHKKMMEDTIKVIQENGNFAFVPDEADAFDIGEIIAHPETKGVWDFDYLKIYEIQNNAIREEIEKCIARAGRYDAWLTFMVSHDGLVAAINEITEKKHQCINISDMIAGLASG